jgi:hypothetical protein
MVGVTLLAHGEPRMAGFTEDSSNIFGWDRPGDVPDSVARIYDPRPPLIYQRLGIPTVATVTWTTGPGGPPVVPRPFGDRVLRPDRARSAPLSGPYRRAGSAAGRVGCRTTTGSARIS